MTGNKLNVDLSYGLKGSYTVEGGDYYTYIYCYACDSDEDGTCAV